MRRRPLLAAGFAAVGLAVLAGVARSGDLPGIDRGTFQRDEGEGARLAEGDSADEVATVDSTAEQVQGEDDRTTSSSSASSAPAPAERVPIAPVEPEGHWLGHGRMTSRSIEVVWSPVLGADRYEIHRVDGLQGFDAATVPLGADTLIHRADGGDPGVAVDPTVVAGRFYTYILDVVVDGEALDRRWTQTLALDDTEPPAPITGLRAERADDGVLLRWEPSSDDVEFAAYAVYLIDDEGGAGLYLGGGGDLEVTSFLDRAPPSGSVTYGVQAADFHDNRTELARITVEVGSG